MDQNRKNPDQLLEIIRQEENKQKRGILYKKSRIISIIF